MKNVFIVIKITDSLEVAVSQHHAIAEDLGKKTFKIALGSIIKYNKY